MIYLLAAGGLWEARNLSGNLGLAFAGGAACYREAGWVSWDTVPAFTGTLRAAYLYWTSGLWAQESGKPRSVGFIKGTREDTLSPDTFYIALTSSGDSIVVMRKEVTSLLQANPSGPVGCRKLGSEPGFAWALVLVYEDPSLPLAHMCFLEGCLALEGGAWSGPVSLGLVPSNPWGYLLLFSVGGEGAWTGDMGRFDALTLSNSRNPSNNIGNETLYDPRSGRYKAFSYPDGPADLDLFDISSALEMGEVDDTLYLASGSDWLYYAFAIVYNAKEGSSGVGEGRRRVFKHLGEYDLSGRRARRGLRIRGRKLIVP